MRRPSPKIHRVIRVDGVGRLKFELHRRSVTGAKDPTAPTQSEGGIDRFQLSNAPEVAVTLERHSLSPYRLTLTDGL